MDHRGEVESGDGKWEMVNSSLKCNTDLWIRPYSYSHSHRGFSPVYKRSRCAEPF